MKKYSMYILCVATLLFLPSCVSQPPEIQTEQTEVVQTATETEKASEIATERVTISTEAVSEIATEERTDPPKMVFTSERKLIFFISASQL